MPNKNTIDRLFDKNTSELMPHELRQMLEAELAKEEMDAEFIAELLDLLVDEAPTDDEKKADWQAIRRRIAKSRPWKWPRAVAAVVALVIAVFAISFTSARAFNWAVLLKYLVPVAQTFGIVSSDYQLEDVSPTEYWAEDTDAQEIDFYTLDAVSARLCREVVESGCIPDGFELANGVWYSDLHIEKCTLMFSADGADQWFVLEFMQVGGEGEITTDYEYERQLDVPDTVVVNGVEVTVYYNSDDQGLYMSWLIGNGDYNIRGNISKDLAEEIISGLVSRHAPSNSEDKHSDGMDASHSMNLRRVLT